MTKYIDTTKTEAAKPEPKKTVFTHILTREIGWQVTEYKPSEYEKVLYLGYCNSDGDTFAAYTEGHIVILKGFKGDEFN